ncbi:MAG: hypothetical protein ACE5ER_11460 [Nitrospinaceae bacterium]
MHTLYKNVEFEDARRILDYCHRHNIHNGGLFEVYSTPGADLHMIIVNSSPEDGPWESFRPLGAFYLNYLHPGSISIENEDPGHDGMPSTRRHVAAIKQVIKSSSGKDAPACISGSTTCPPSKPSTPSPKHPLPKVDTPSPLQNLSRACRRRGLRGIPVPLSQSKGDR